MPFFSRKSTRLPGYDYATGNYYFITICTHEKKCLFGSAGKSKFGKLAEECLLQIPEHFSNVMLDKWVIMPNHIHAIIVLRSNVTDQQLPALSTIVGQYKAAVTKKSHVIAPELQIWQRSFHDHIIRGQQDYAKIWEYIENNPKKWEEDCFYIEYK